MGMVMVMVMGKVTGKVMVMVMGKVMVMVMVMGKVIGKVMGRVMGRVMVMVMVMELHVCCACVYTSCVCECLLNLRSFLPKVCSMKSATRYPMSPSTIQ